MSDPKIVHLSKATVRPGEAFSILGPNFRKFGESGKGLTVRFVADGNVTVGKVEQLESCQVQYAGIDNIVAPEVTKETLCKVVVTKKEKKAGDPEPKDYDYESPEKLKVIPLDDTKCPDDPAYLTVDHDECDSEHYYKLDPKPSPTFTLDRYTYKKSVAWGILRENFIGHLVFFEKDAKTPTPAFPVMYAPASPDGDITKLYFHGPVVSHFTKVPNPVVALTVTQVTGIVLARAAFSHGLQFNSAVIHGKARQLEEKDRGAAFQRIFDHVVPGRWNDIRHPEDFETHVTAVTEIEITGASAKVRQGQAADTQYDVDRDEHWAGVLPVRPSYGPPVPAVRVGPNHPTPDYLTGYRGPGRPYPA